MAHMMTCAMVKTPVVRGMGEFQDELLTYNFLSRLLVKFIPSRVVHVIYSIILYHLHIHFVLYIKYAVHRNVTLCIPSSFYITTILYSYLHPYNSPTMSNSCLIPNKSSVERFTLGVLPRLVREKSHHPAQLFCCMSLSEGGS